MATTTTHNVDPTMMASSAESDDGRSSGGRRAVAEYAPPNLPTSDGLRAPAGGLLKGAVNQQGELKDAGLMVGIKLDLEAEVHLTARVRGDVVVGLY